MKAAIIGSGVASLAISIRLAKLGYDVQVFEANESIGGKLYSFHQDGYRFDGGPSLFTMPMYVTELLALADLNETDVFDYEELEESCRYFWPDGSQLKGFSNPEKFAQEAEQAFGVDRNTVLAYFDHIKSIYESSGKIFLEKSLHQSETWLSKDALSALLKIHRFDLFKSMHQANLKRLKEPHLVQLFDRFATYNGSNPYKAPGILNVIPWLEHGFGTFFPKGGMRQIPIALEQAAKKLGVQFHTNCLVKEILHDKKGANGLLVQMQSEGDQTFQADVVVSNSDVYYTYENLLPNVPTPKRIKTQERSGSAVVFYWGIARSFPELHLHNIFFSNDYKKEFETLFTEKQLPEDPTVYVNVSSKLEKSDAPESCENWFVMINAPSHESQDWRNSISQLRARVIKILGDRLQVNLEKLIATERIWSPPDIQRDTMSFKGALYGTSSNSQLAAFLRHPNFSNQLEHLYFCGGSVHPGGGIPLALLSAKITSEIITDHEAE
jgi:diapolycopene oxygenase